MRVELDDRGEKLGYRIREAQMQKTPYMLVVGAREAEAGTVSVRLRGGEELGSLRGRRDRGADGRAGEVEEPGAIGYDCGFGAEKEFTVPKQKTHKGAAKRFKLSATGKVRRGHSGKTHILTKKSSKRKRKLRQQTRSVGSVREADSQPPPLSSQSTFSGDIVAGGRDPGTSLSSGP